jgi:hypothetical protein
MELRPTHRSIMEPISDLSHALQGNDRISDGDRRTNLEQMWEHFIRMHEARFAFGTAVDSIKPDIDSPASRIVPSEPPR